MMDSKLYNMLTAWAGDNLWVVQVFVVVFLVLLLNLAVRVLAGRLYRRAQLSRTPWDDAVIDALRRPVPVLVWIVGIAFAAGIVQHETGAAIFQAVVPIRDVGVITTLAWFLLRLTRNVQSNVLAANADREEPVDSTTVEALGKLFSASIMITAVLVALQTLGFSISGVLAFGGIGGIAVGFAAKDLLANFFGGLMIYLDRPFSVGDWIRSDDREIEGTVEHIGWRLTRIRTFDKRPLYIPNGIFSAIVVVNPSRMTRRRIHETIGIRYEDVDRLPAILADVKRMLTEHPDIDDTQTLMVNFNSFGPSSLDFFVYTFTHTTVWTTYHQVKEDVLLKISAIISAHGAEIAYPTSTLHMPGLEQATAHAAHTG